MTERVPSMPSPFLKLTKNINIAPNPRTVRASDMTWFNTCGSKIIKTDYNTCSGDIDNHMYPWGIMASPRNVPFNLKPWGGQGKCDMFQRFDLYGVSSKCGCELNKCGCSDPRKNICPLSGGAYVNPN